MGDIAIRPDDQLDDLDRKLLNIIQADFPIAPHPYAILGDKVGLAEKEAFERVEAMREKGIIRRLGANFQSARLGFVSTLCAAKVSAAKLENFIKEANALEGVTHNYERDHVYNIWFTLISPSREESEKTLAELSRKTGVEILNLPATKLFKIKVDFQM